MLYFAQPLIGRSICTNGTVSAVIAIAKPRGSPKQSYAESVPADDISKVAEHTDKIKILPGSRLMYSCQEVDDRAESRLIKPESRILIARPNNQTNP